MKKESKKKESVESVKEELRVGRGETQVAALLNYFGLEIRNEGEDPISAWVIELKK